MDLKNEYFRIINKRPWWPDVDEICFTTNKIMGSNKIATIVHVKVNGDPIEYNVEWVDIYQYVTNIDA